MGGSSIKDDADGIWGTSGWGADLTGEYDQPNYSVQALSRW